jgi:hypothetical protein
LAERLAANDSGMRHAAMAKFDVSALLTPFRFTH